MFCLEMTAYQKRQNFAILKNPSNVLSIILGPGQARSSLTTDKQTEIQL